MAFVRASVQLTFLASFTVKCVSFVLFAFIFPPSTFPVPLTWPITFNFLPSYRRVRFLSVRLAAEYLIFPLISRPSTFVLLSSYRREPFFCLHLTAEKLFFPLLSSYRRVPFPLFLLSRSSGCLPRISHNLCKSFAR